MTVGRAGGDGRWRIRKMTNLLAPNWTLHDPTGSWSGRFYAHDEAVKRMKERTRTAINAIERWLMEQRGPSDG